jgi:predicted aconitase with swiveling domain
MRRVRLAAEILVAGARARRRMRHERDTRALVAATRGGPAPTARASVGAVREGRRLGRAVHRVLWMLPRERGCLTRSLVLLELMQRRGIAATLVIGAKAEPAFAAHAWVELDGEPLLTPGGYEAGRLAEL